MPVTEKHGFYQRVPVLRVMLYFLIWQVLVFALAHAVVWLIPKLPFLPKWGMAVGLVIGGIVIACAAVLALLIMARFENRTLSSFGFQYRGMFLSASGGCLVGVVLVLVFTSILILTGICHIVGLNADFSWMLALLYAIGASFGEETVFRGYTLPSIERSWGTGIAVLLSSCAFSIYHIFSIEYSSHIYRAVLIGLLGGTVYAAAYVMTQNIWFPIGLHCGWDFAELTLFGTDNEQPFLMTTVHGSLLLTGGNVGVVAGLPFIMVCVTASVLMFRIGIKKHHWQELKRQ